ncbi:MAG: hypothetical protein ABW292_20755, partial [Vicinamibacterales bacterium]
FRCRSSPSREVCRMSHEPDALVDEALRALAADDERVSVSARVHDAVLREWDQRHGVRQRRRMHHQPRRLAWVVVPAAAALLLAAAGLQRESVRDPTSEAAPTTNVISIDVPAISSGPGPLLEESSGNAELPSPIAVLGRSPAAIDGSVGYVIVPGPLVDPSALHVVRARMSRAALASLGMPIVDPNLDGVVEVEMLVGDDGVAQSIRHATLVSD